MKIVTSTALAFALGTSGTAAVAQLAGEVGAQAQGTLETQVPDPGPAVEETTAPVTSTVDQTLDSAEAEVETTTEGAGETVADGAERTWEQVEDTDVGVSAEAGASADALDAGVSADAEVEADAEAETSIGR